MRQESIRLWHSSLVWINSSFVNLDDLPAVASGTSSLVRLGVRREQKGRVALTSGGGGREEERSELMDCIEGLSLYTYMSITVTTV